MPNIPIISMNAGELSPLISERSDVEKYQSGCRHLQNFIPTIYGAAVRRPGTHNISTQYDNTEDVVRLIPFVFSETIAYTIELGDQYLRAFSTVTNGGEIVYDNGSEVTVSLTAITTPYLAADIPDLHIRQLGDTMWITHKDYPQYKLTRTSPSSFALNEVPFTKGPFLTRNDLVSPNTTDTALMRLDGTVSVNSDYIPAETYHFFDSAIDWFTQTITFPYSFTLASFKIWGCRRGTPGDLTILIKNTISQEELIGYPSSTTYATITVPEADQPATYSSGSWITCTLTTPITITANILYSFVLHQAGATGAANSFYWGRNASASDDYYGRTWNSANSGSTWTIYNDIDYSLQVIDQTVLAQTVGFYGTMSCVDDTSPTPVDVAFFENGHVGTLFKLTYPRTTKVSKGRFVNGSTLPYTICEAIDIKGSMRFTAFGHNKATIELERNENGAGWETVEVWVSEGDINSSYTKVEEADNVQYRAIVSAFQYNNISDPYLRASITTSNGTQDCIVRILSIIDSSSANIIVVSGNGTTTATRRWAEGAWSPLRGYPNSVAFFEDRCCYLGMTDLQTQVLFDNVPGHVEPKLPKVWLSQTGDYEDFESDVKDADSFDRVIPSANDARWIEAQEALVVGTSGDEWRVGSNKMEQFITPQNATVRKQSTHGSNSVQSITINDQMLFVDSVGRKLRELVYDGDKYRSLDLTAMAEHITDSGIVGVAYQHNPDSIVWCCLADGSLIGMVYEKAEKVIAWFKVPIAGKVKSVCVIPGITEDEVWIAVERTISGTDTIFIEKFANRNFGDYIDDAYFLDCGLTYSTAEKMTYDGEDLLWEGHIVMFGDQFSTVSGLSHLNGETVSVLADGVVFDDAVVASGAITLKLSGTATTAQKAHVGKKYRSKLVPMKPVANTQMGSSAASIVSCKEIGISFLNTRGAQYGVTDDDLFDINYDNPQWQNNADTITGLFTGTVSVSIAGGFSIDNNLIVSTDSPLPCTVRALIPKVEVTGR